MARSKLCADFFRSNTEFCHHHKHMIGKICRLIDCLCTITAFACNDNFRTLFPYFLQDLIYSFLKQVTGIRPLGEFFFPGKEELIKRIKRKLLRFLLFTLQKRPGKAGIRPEVAGRAIFMDFYQESIPVTIRRNGYNVLIIPACLSLQPQFLPGTAPKTASFTIAGISPSLSNFSSETSIIQILLTGIPFSASTCFSTGIRTSPK